MPFFKSQTEFSEIFRQVTGENWVTPWFCTTRLHVRPEYFREFTWSTILSDTVLNRMFPLWKEPIELEHFTTFAGFTGIISTGQLRLYWVRKRLSDHELQSFASDHRLHGYISGPSPYYVELSEQLFFCSMTQPQSGDDQRLWDNFGEKQRGVRLRFRVTSKAADLRPIYYGGAKRTLLSELNHKLETKTRRIFLPSSISKIGAFYLPLGFKDEAEVRLLLRKTPHVNGWGVDGVNEYCAVPINQPNPICVLDLASVAPGQNADRTEIKNLMMTSRFASVPVL
jgi:hypothetical protein